MKKNYIQILSKKIFINLNENTSKYTVLNIIDETLKTYIKKYTKFINIKKKKDETVLIETIIDNVNLPNFNQDSINYSNIQLYTNFLSLHINHSKNILITIEYLKSIFTHKTIYKEFGRNTHSNLILKDITKLFSIYIKKYEQIIKKNFFLKNMTVLNTYVNNRKLKRFNLKLINNKTITSYIEFLCTEIYNCTNILIKIEYHPILESILTNNLIYRKFENNLSKYNILKEISEMFLIYIKKYELLIKIRREKEKIVFLKTLIDEIPIEKFYLEYIDNDNIESYIDFLSNKIKNCTEISIFLEYSRKFYQLLCL